MVATIGYLLFRVLQFFFQLLVNNMKSHRKIQMACSVVKTVDKKGLKWSTNEGQWSVSVLSILHMFSLYLLTTHDGSSVCEHFACRLFFSVLSVRGRHVCACTRVCAFMHASAPNMNPRIGVKEQENSSLRIPSFPLLPSLFPFVSLSLSLSHVGCLEILTKLVFIFQI